LTVIDLLPTFVSRRVQPLDRREMTIWTYPGPSCPDHFFSAELDGTKINTLIRGMLVHGADQNSSPSSVPLREVDVSPWRVCLSLFSFACVNFCFINTYAFLCWILGSCTMPHRGSQCLRLIVPTLNGNRHGGKGGGFGVPPR
jgi:hypothetical protein